MNISRITQRRLEWGAGKDKRKKMRGIGGPLLCIGDLLTDVGEADPHSDQPSPLSPSSSSSIPFSPHTVQPSHLNRLFQVFHFFIFLMSVASLICEFYPFLLSNFIFVGCYNYFCDVQNCVPNFQHITKSRFNL